MSIVPQRTAPEYAAMLKALLPRGMAWALRPLSVLSRTLDATAEEPARIDADAHRLIKESNPLTAWDAMDEWEQNMGLPDACSQTGATMQERRDAVIAKFTDSGREDLAWWHELAATLGYEITIEEFSPFVCGIAEFGDADAYGQEHPRTGRFGPEEIRYWWNVIVHGPRFILFRCSESSPPDRFGDFRTAQDLECIMQRDKEAHNVLTFEYREE